MNRSELYDESTAEAQSTIALKSIFDSLGRREDFKLEAGAGAGKTYSLIAALRHILEDPPRYLPRPDQRVACLTYTKVARDEIISRTDDHPSVFADTLHGFLWEIIAPFQKALAALILESTEWADTLDGRVDLDGLPIEYDLGIRGIGESVRLHHDDIPRLAIQLFENSKFKSLIADRFPIIFIDEYQDTPAGLIESMLAGQTPNTTIFGFFGDSWQQIYERTCGSISDPRVKQIDKNANFRSGRRIVDFLNKMRPELPQAPASTAIDGTVKIFHTNEWSGPRLTHNWKGQLPHDATHAVLDHVIRSEAGTRHEPSAQPKVLMLTHSALAKELGYESLPQIYKYNDAFAKKEDEVIAYLLDVVEPAVEAFQSKRYGELFEVVGGRPQLNSREDKVVWSSTFEQILRSRESGTVGDVLDILMDQTLFSLPSRVLKREDARKQAIAGAEHELAVLDRRQGEYADLRGVAYSEIESLYKYVEDRTMFSTKHNVKGAEFDDVVVVLGRGWSSYNFAEMLANFEQRANLADKELASYERTRNLFYVAASRAKNNLVLLFVQELGERALRSLAEWTGPENVISIKFGPTGNPL